MSRVWELIKLKNKKCEIDFSYRSVRNDGIKIKNADMD
jgi:hypothetical protein